MQAALHNRVGKGLRTTRAAPVELDIPLAMAVHHDPSLRFRVPWFLGILADQDLDH